MLHDFESMHSAREKVAKRLGLAPAVRGHPAVSLPTQPEQKSYAHVGAHYQQLKGAESTVIGPLSLLYKLEQGDLSAEKAVCG